MKTVAPETGCWPPCTVPLMVTPSDSIGGPPRFIPFLTPQPLTINIPEAPRTIARPASVFRRLRAPPQADEFPFPLRDIEISSIFRNIRVVFGCFHTAGDGELRRGAELPHNCTRTTVKTQPHQCPRLDFLCEFKKGDTEETCDLPMLRTFSLYFRERTTSQNKDGRTVQLYEHGHIKLRLKLRALFPLRT